MTYSQNDKFSLEIYSRMEAETYDGNLEMGE